MKTLHLPNKWRIWINRIVGIAMIFLVTGIAACFAWLHTESGFSWISQKTYHATRGIVEIKGLDGLLPFNLSARELHLRDSDGTVWLSIRNIYARTNLRAALKKQLALAKTDIGWVEWNHMPHFYSGDGSGGGTSTISRILPDALDALNLNDAIVRQAVIATNIIGYEFRGSLRGHASWHGDDDIYAEASGPVTVSGIVTTRLEAVFKFENRFLIFPSLSVKAGEDHFSGSAIYRIKSRFLASTSECSVADAALYKPFHRLDLRGPQSLRITANHLARGEPWLFSLQADSPGFSFSQYTNQQVRIDGGASLSATSIQYQVNYDAKQAAAAGWSLYGLSASAEGQNWDARLKIIADGEHSSGNNFKVASALELSRQPSPSGWQVAVPEAEGTWNQRDFKLQEPTTYSYSNEQHRLAAPAFTIAGAQGAVDLQISKQLLTDGNLFLGGIAAGDLAAILNYQGDLVYTSAVLNIRANGSSLTSNPRASAELTVNGLATHHSVLHVFNGGSLVATARLDASTAHADLALEHPALTNCTVKVQAPVRKLSGLLPVGIDWSKDVSADVSLSTELKYFSDTLTNNLTAFKGALDVNMSASGLPTDPLFAGHLSLENGQLRYPGTGTYLDQINIQCAGSGHNIELLSATAADGGPGALRGNGNLLFDGTIIPQWNLDLALTNLTLFRLIQSELPLSGNVSYSGVQTGSWIRGEVFLESSAFTIPKRLPRTVRTLPVTEINHPDPTRNTSQAALPGGTAKEPADANPVNYDLRIKTRSIYGVKGRGLQSEWQGSAYLKGNSRNPLVTGSAQITKGYAMLLGRRFNLDVGTIDLTGELPPKPQLNINASTRIADAVARLIISGTTDKPEITMTSDPMMTENEIMAMILFGKSTETMSPWQAIALANGLRILSGQSGDLVEILDSGQSVLKLDQIEIRQDEKGEGLSSLSVGKYIGSGLYVEGEKGMGTAEDKFTMSYELSRRLVLETEASPRIREGIRLFWRREL